MISYLSIFKEQAQTINRNSNKNYTNINNNLKKIINSNKNKTLKITSKFVLYTYNYKEFLIIKKKLPLLLLKFQKYKFLIINKPFGYKQKKNKTTVLKSPHIFKSSGENFSYFYYELNFTIENNNFFILKYFQEYIYKSFKFDIGGYVEYKIKQI